MPRQARLDSAGTLHHVMIRGIEGVRIFRDDSDRETFTHRVSQLVKSTGNRILAWVLMDTHAHLLVVSGSRGIAGFMRQLLTGYAIGFNRKYRRRGHLFQNRYKSIVCQEDRYLMELVRYIHLNPLRAGVVRSLEQLDRYRWSGHRVLIGKGKGNDWQERDYVLNQFGNREGKAVRAYRRYMEEGKEQGWRPELVGGGLIRSMGGWSQVLSLRGRGEKVEHDARVLGEGDFVAGILKEADRGLRRQLREGRDRGKDVIQRVIGKVCKEKGVKEEEVRNGSQRREVSRVRGRISYQLNREWGISLAEIARNVGVSTSAVSNAIRKLEP